LFAVEEFLKKITSDQGWTGNRVGSPMAQFIQFSKRSRGSFGNGHELVNELQKIISSFKENVLSPSSVNVEFQSDHNGVTPLVLFHIQ
jgi:hypothetical protein